MDDPFDAGSVFSHEERAIAAALAEGTDPETIAERRDQSVEAVEAAIDRIETKTDRALATVGQSPVLETSIEALSEAERSKLRDRLDPLRSE